MISNLKYCHHYFPFGNAWAMGPTYGPTNQQKSWRRKQPWSRDFSWPSLLLSHSSCIPRPLAVNGWVFFGGPGGVKRRRLFFFFFGACESWSIIACLYFLGWTTPGTPPRICQSIDRSVYSYQPADITRFAHNFEHVSFEQYNTGAGGVFLFTGTLPHVWSKWYNYHVLYLVTLTFGSSVFRVILLVTWLNSTLVVLLSQVYTDKHLDDPRMYIWFSMMRFRWKHRETHIASGQHIVYKHVDSLISVQMFHKMFPLELGDLPLLIYIDLQEKPQGVQHVDSNFVAALFFSFQSQALPCPRKAGIAPRVMEVTLGTNISHHRN